MVISAECIIIALSIYLFFNPPVYTHQPDTIPEGCISSEQAYSIAMPYIEEYAQETNRVISRIDVSFSNNYPDGIGLRGEPFLCYPMWEVSAYFPNPEEYGVVGYSVFIWADTGQLYHKGAQGIM